MNTYLALFLLYIWFMILSWMVLACIAVAFDGKVGLLCRAGSLWVGAHYAPFNRRWCINLVPCVTLWITLKGGKTP